MLYHRIAYAEHCVRLFAALAAVAALGIYGATHAATPPMACQSLHVDDVEHRSADAEPSGSRTTDRGRCAADALQPFEVVAWLFSSGALSAPRCCTAGYFATCCSSRASSAYRFGYYLHAGWSAARRWLRGSS